MTITPLSLLSPLDGRYFEKVKNLQSFCSEHALIQYRLRVEMEWLKALAMHPLVVPLSPFSKKAVGILEGLIQTFNEKEAERVKAIEQTTHHDVKAVEYYLQEKCLASNNPELKQAVSFIHFGCTSEDINNLAYGLMLKDIRAHALLPKIEQLIGDLQQLAYQFAGEPMVSRTHGQVATPTTLGKELANFVARLDRQRAQISALPILGKMNGAVGNYNAMSVAYPNINWPELSQTFVESFGFTFNPYTTQIEPHDFMAEWFDALSRQNTILIDLNRDFWGYTSLGYFKQKIKKKEVGSSTMPHKVNPIAFENSEGNCGIANALFQHLARTLPISRWQRDLTDSTRLRNIGVAFGHSLLAVDMCLQGLHKLEVNAPIMNQDLESSWEVLAEPIQTVMRRYKIPDAYETLKAFTRGKKMTRKMLHQFIDTLTIPKDAKKQLKTLTPSSYVGYAPKLAKMGKYKSWPS
ncbi:MAG: adenylosuccinate lyase [Gammaproteobacteria bacterium]|nr:adenylosuccinate lyase [Gammaproteobacteria bacterium]